MLKDVNVMIEEWGIGDVLDNTTIDYTEKKLKELLKEATEDEKEYFDFVEKCEQDDYEYELIDEVQEADRDYPLHSNKSQLKSAIYKIRARKAKKTAMREVKNIFREFANSDCTECVDYLNKNELKKELKQAVKEAKKLERLENNEGKVIDQWVEDLSK